MTKGVKIKVCGMRETENIRQVAALKPDYMGFIFYPHSPRYVGAEFLLPADLDPSIQRVGVFVNSPADEVIATMNTYRLQYAQLHGDEDTAFCEALKSAGVNIIKVFRVDASFDFSATIPFENTADFFLFDTKGKQYGGNAIPFDWQLLQRYNQALPFFLSGGIQPELIGAIKNLPSLQLHAIDVNSGVEDRPGVKNPEKISAIINQLSL